MMERMGLGSEYLDKVLIAKSPGRGKFASITHNWFEIPLRHRPGAYSEVAAMPPQNFTNYVSKENPIKMIGVGLIGVLIYFIFMKIIKIFVKAVVEFIRENPFDN